MAFFSVFWGFFHASLSPDVYVGSSWPPLGIDALDPFAIPLLNTLLLLSSGVRLKCDIFDLFLLNSILLPLPFSKSKTPSLKRIGPHNEDVFSVIIGSLLGDGYANKRSGEGVRICYRQSIKHKEYLFWLYTFFFNRGYTSNLQPRQYTKTIKSKEGKVYYGYEFNTFTFRSFSLIHKMFYKNGKKVIPLNIYEYLTPLALAVWIMDDGCWVSSGVRIATNSFKLEEVEILNNVLKSKYNLETTIQNIWLQNQYSIYIKKESVNNLRNIVGPYIHSSMLYKLGVDNTY